MQMPNILCRVSEMIKKTLKLKNKTLIDDCAVCKCIYIYIYKLYNNRYSSRRRHIIYYNLTNARISRIFATLETIYIIIYNTIL